MRPRTTILAAAAFAASGVPAIATPTAAAAAYSGSRGVGPDIASTSDGNLVIGSLACGWSQVMAPLNERSFRGSNDTMEQASNGATDTAGSAGGLPSVGPVH